MSIPELEVLRTEVETRLNTGNFVDLFAKVNKLPFCKGIKAYQTAFTSNNLPNGLLVFQQQVGLFLYACIDGEIARLQAIKNTPNYTTKTTKPNYVWVWVLVFVGIGLLIWNNLESNETQALKYFNQALETKDLQEKINLYTKAIALKPDYVDAYHYRGNAKCGLGRYKEAIEDYNKAIALKPDYEKAYNNRGSAKDELGKYQEAIEDYNKAIAFKPDYALAFFNKALVYAHLKNKNQILSSLQEAIRLDSQLKETAKLASGFNWLRGDKGFEELLK